MFEDSGWHHICGTKQSGTQYFVKVRNDGNDDIFSDLYSRAGRYKRISKMWQNLAITWILIVLVYILTDYSTIENMLNPKYFYHTPGLWELKGLKFLKAFLIETPLAFCRGYWLLVLIVTAVVYVVFSVRSNKMYKKTLDQNV